MKFGFCFLKCLTEDSFSIFRLFLVYCFYLITLEKNDWTRLCLGLSNSSFGSACSIIIPSSMNTT